MNTSGEVISVRKENDPPLSDPKYPAINQDINNLYDIFGEVYDFWVGFNRDGPDNKGSKLKAVINFLFVLGVPRICETVRFNFAGI